MHMFSSLRFPPAAAAAAAAAHPAGASSARFLEEACLPYACDVCGADFAWECDLDDHQQLHMMQQDGGHVEHEDYTMFQAPAAAAAPAPPPPPPAAAAAAAAAQPPRARPTLRKAESAPGITSCMRPARLV